MQHVAFEYGTIATTHACRALRPAPIARTNVSPIWHVRVWRLKPLSAPVSSPLHTPQPRIVHWRR
eukprot:4000085-Pyramimonas_sp.AAC.1